MAGKKKTKRIPENGMKRGLSSGKTSKFQTIKDSLVVDVFPKFQYGGKQGAEAVLAWANNNPNDFIIKLMAKLLPRETNTTIENFDGKSIRDLTNAQVVRELQDRGIDLRSEIEGPSDGTTDPVH